MVDRGLLLQALRDLGYNYQTGSQVIEGSAGIKANISIKIISRFGNDIGLRKNKGTYRIIADWWGVMGTSEKEFSEQLSQKYAYLAVKSKLEKQGFTLASEENDSGKIRLVLRRVV